MSAEDKRLDSLARNRASAELKRRHPEEWEEIRKGFHHDLLVERAVIGKVERSRNEPVHVDAGDGTCDYCGKSVPCEQMRKRERARLARLEEPAPTPSE